MQIFKKAQVIGFPNTISDGINNSLSERTTVHMKNADETHLHAVKLEQMVHMMHILTRKCPPHWILFHCRWTNWAIKAVTIPSVPRIVLNRVLQKLWQHFTSIKAEPKGWIWFHRSRSRSKGHVCGAQETGFSFLWVVIGARWELTSPEASANHVPVCECEWVTSGLERVWVARRRIQRGGLRRAKSCLYNPG